MEKATRDIVYGVLSAQTAYADVNPNKIHLHDPLDNSETLLERQRDSNGEHFWSVVTSIPLDRHKMMKRYKAPTPITGLTVDGVRTQQSHGFLTGILNKLKEPGSSPATSESYILDDDNKLFNRPVAKAHNLRGVEVSVKKSRTIPRDAG